jgi:hypothetical protein
MGRFSRVIVVTAVVASLAAACSSSAKPKTDNGKPLSKAEYIRQSDAICSSYRDRIGAVVGAAGGGLSVTEAKDIYNTKLIPLFEAELHELRLLRPPKADAALLNNALLAMSSAINTIQGRVGGAHSIADLNAINPTGIARWKTAAAKYGMHACGTLQK